MKDFFSGDHWHNFLDSIVKYMKDYGPKLLGAILIVWIGLKIIDWLEKYLERLFKRLKLDKALVPFLVSMISICMKVFLFLFGAGMVGFHPDSLVTVIAAAGFAIGFALQGSLANFAAGILILLFKPYRIGDLVDINGQHGHVEEIQIFNTVITTLENKKVIIPNSMPIGDNIVNYSEKEFIRVDLNVFMPYSEEFDKVEALLLESINDIEQVLDTPKTYIGIEEFDTHSILLAVRPHCRPEDYWDVFFEGNKRIKSTFGKAGIKVAYSEGVELGEIGK